MKYSRTQWWLPKLLCLIAACAFWVYVMNEQNPVMENTYTIPVEVRNLDRSLVATNVPVKGTARIMLLTGQTIWNQVLPAGSSRTDLTLNKGTYILQVGFGRILEQQLFIIAQ